MGYKQRPTHDPAFAAGAHWRQPRPILIMLLLLNAVLGTSVWSYQLNGYLSECLAIRYLPRHMVRMCGQSIDTTAGQAPEYPPRARRSAADSIQLHVWEHDLTGRMPRLRLLLRITVSRSLLMAYPISVGLVLMSVAVLQGRRRWR